MEEILQQYEIPPERKTMLHIIWIGIQNWVYDNFDEALPRGEEVSVDEFEMQK